MSRTLLARLERLEARRNPLKSQREKGMVVIEGTAEGDDGGQIEALVRHGDARADDTFIVIRRMTPSRPRYSDLRPYRRFGTEIQYLPMEHLQ